MTKWAKVEYGEGTIEALAEIGIDAEKEVNQALAKDRIQQLAKQAKFAMEISNDPNSPPSWWGAGHNDTFERFAELIVRECIGRVSFVSDGIKQFDPENADSIDLCDIIASDMKKHFGVE